MHITIHKMHVYVPVFVRIIWIIHVFELMLFFFLQENSLTSEGWVTRLSAYLLPMISTKHLGRVLLNFSYVLWSKPLPHPNLHPSLCVWWISYDKLVDCCAWKLACMAKHGKLCLICSNSEMHQILVNLNQSGQSCQLALPFGSLK